LHGNFRIARYNNRPVCQRAKRKVLTPQNNGTYSRQQSTDADDEEGTKIRHGDRLGGTAGKGGNWCNERTIEAKGDWRKRRGNGIKGQ